MKYITTEVYKKMQQTDLHFLLVEDERAAEFSEEYYKQVFDIQKVNTRHWLSRNKTDEYVIDERVLKHHREKMPDELFSIIADFRVFVLGYATKEVIDTITSFSNQMRKEVDEEFKKYYEYQRSLEETFPKHILEWFGFHDCSIGYYNELNMVDNTKRLSVSINNLGGFTTITRIEFIDVKEHNITDDFVNDYMLYSEVYKVKEGYEFMYLTNSGEIRVVCSDIVYFEE